jgi:hypothetical protein
VSDTTGATDAPDAASLPGTSGTLNSGSTTKKKRKRSRSSDTTR